MPVNDICKAITSDRVIPVKVASVHIPEFAASHPGILLSDGTYILQHKSLLGGLQQYF